MSAAPEQPFGCPGCWPDSPDRAWDARMALSLRTRLVDESHFIVSVLACPKCSQSFVSVFTETIDWADGDDPQCWVLLPVTPEEAAGLVDKGSSVTDADIGALGRGRRSLTKDAPKGNRVRCFWSEGLSVRWHD